MILDYVHHGILYADCKPTWTNLTEESWTAFGNPLHSCARDYGWLENV